MTTFIKTLIIHIDSAIVTNQPTEQIEKKQQAFSRYEHHQNWAHIDFEMVTCRLMMPLSKGEVKDNPHILVTIALF